MNYNKILNGLINKLILKINKINKNSMNIN